jgi:Asp-tRNA(Asn)/Glu-tRNA(Gln) amidotransferase A subunit family amidase
LLDNDDVLSISFFAHIVFPKSSPATLTDYFEGRGITTSLLSDYVNIPSAPYFLHQTGSLSQVYRVYPDNNLAFTQGLIEAADPEDGFSPVAAAAADPGIGVIGIPVPSRHYFPSPSTERPLSGVRTGVKDIYDLKGTKTGAGSRAYFETYPPTNQTAPSVQRLVDLGAVVVGKLKTTQFASSERPTADMVDYMAPWNPRGDEYQNPSASSSGAGAALAAYDWLDMAVASDTGGSIRMPSAVNGVFGMRITNGSMPLDGIVPITAKMDTPGLMARSAELLQVAYKSWLPGPISSQAFPKRIILPDEFWPTLENKSMEVYDDFIANLATLLDAEVERVDTNRSFIEYTNSTGLNDFVGPFPLVLIVDQWRDLGEPFVNDYQARFGRYPFISPVARGGLALVPNIDPATYKEAVRRLSIYKEWFTTELVPSCEEALVLYPIGPGQEDYRDDSLNEPPQSPVAPYIGMIQASAAGTPEYTFPIGKSRYQSRVSMREEELPVSIGMIGGAGCDGMLVDLVAKVTSEVEGLKAEVMTGRSIW